MGALTLPLGSSLVSARLPTIFSAGPTLLASMVRTGTMSISHIVVRLEDWCDRHHAWIIELPVVTSVESGLGVQVPAGVALQLGSRLAFLHLGPCI